MLGALTRFAQRSLFQAFILYSVILYSMISVSEKISLTQVLITKNNGMRNRRAEFSQRGEGLFCQIAHKKMLIPISVCKYALVVPIVHTNSSVIITRFMSKRQLWGVRRENYYIQIARGRSQVYFFARRKLNRSLLGSRRYDIIQSRTFACQANSSGKNSRFLC